MTAVGQRSKQLADYFGQLPTRVNVLRAIYNSGGISRADIARSTGLTKVTVSEIVSNLNRFDLIEESEPQRSSNPGKPPILVQIRRDALRTIAVDASSRDVLVVGSIDLYGMILNQRTIKIKAAGETEFLQAIEDAISEEIAFSSQVVVGVGVGVAGVVDSAGTLVDAAALGMRDFPLQRLLVEKFGLEVNVANDANVATKADSLFGGGNSSHLLIRISEGVGAGLIFDGQPYLGENFAAGELGHVVVTNDGVLCNCGKRGCLEAEIAHLISLGTSDPRAIGDLLGQVVSPIASVLNLPELVISCSFDQSAELTEAISSRIQATTLPETSESLVVRHSKLGKDIVLLGAAALSLSAVLGVA